MKRIAGSIIAGFGLLVTALGHLSVSESVHVLGTKYYLNLDTPIEILAILFIVGGIVLIGWAIWEARKRGKNQ